MKGLFIFAAGVVAGAVAGAYLVKDKVMADAKQEIEEVREYYKSKKETKKEEEPVEEKQETKVEEEYQEITRNYTNYNKIEEAPKQAVNDMPYMINPEDFGEEEGYDTLTLTYFADKVLVDDVDDVIDDPDPVVGLENLKVFDEFNASAIYVRNDIWKTDFEILKDDWEWKDIEAGPQGPVTETVIEKKPHQL